MTPRRMTPEHLADYVLGLLEPGEAASVDAALAVSDELRREVAQLRGALFSIPQELEPEVLPPRAWEALRARLPQGAQDGSPPGPHAVRDSVPPARPTPFPTTQPPSRPSGSPATQPPPRQSGDVSQPPEAPARRRWGTAFLRPAFAIVLVLLAATATWGALRAREATALEREQRILAHWMRNPEARIVRLDPLGTLDAGILCIMPDGRAMVLQPDRAPTGSTYVLFGTGSGGRVELGRSRGRMILFRTDGLVHVSLDVQGNDNQPVGAVALQ